MLETAASAGMVETASAANMLETASADMLEALFGSHRIPKPSAGAGPSSCTSSQSEKQLCEQVEQLEREHNSQPTVSPARVLRNPVDVAQRRRRRERILAARWEAAAHAREEIAPVLTAMRRTTKLRDLPCGTRIWVAGLGKGTYLASPQCQLSCFHFKLDRAVDGRFKLDRAVDGHMCRKLVPHHTTWGILPPREHEYAVRLATFQSFLPRLTKQHERDLINDQHELGSVDRERVRHADLSRRAAITNRANGASCDIDPLLSLSRRAKNAASRKASWSSRKCNRFRINSKELAFPIPSADVAERCEAATRRTKAAEEAANAAWAAIERDNLAKQRHSNAEQRTPEQCTFEELRNVILTKYRPQLEYDLGMGTIFEPFPLSDAPAKTFLGRYKRAVAMSTESEATGPTVAAYHGTRSANFKSIAEHGLVVPGHGHGVTVAHGSAHGVGIYTAKLGSPDLSLSFSDTKELLVCGVIDCKIDSGIMAKERQQKPRLKYGAGRARGHRVTSRPGQVRGKAAQLAVRRIGRLPVHRDVPGNIRHVGSAMVVFQEDRVAPLFKASPSRYQGRYYNASARSATVDPMWWKTGNPNATKASVSGTQRTRQTIIGGEILFLPPGPVEWYTRRTQHVKRRQVAKVRDVARRRDREIKTTLLRMHDPILDLSPHSN